MSIMQFLPMRSMGRGTTQSVVEGSGRARPAWWSFPSTTRLRRAVPLPALRAGSN